MERVGLAVMLTAALARTVSSEDNKAPILESLTPSGSLEQKLDTRAAPKTQGETYFPIQTDNNDSRMKRFYEALNKDPSLVFAKNGGVPNDPNELSVGVACVDGRELYVVEVKLVGTRSWKRGEPVYALPLSFYEKGPTTVYVPVVGSNNELRYPITDTPNAGLVVYDRDGKTRKASNSQRREFYRGLGCVTTAATAMYNAERRKPQYLARRRQ